MRPDDDTIKINLSVFYQRQKEYKKAEEVLKYLLTKNPQNANLHFRLGLVYKDAGHYEAAVSEFLKSIELAPHIINPYDRTREPLCYSDERFREGKILLYSRELRRRLKQNPE